MSLLETAQALKQHAEQSHKSYLAYGPPGSGKTTFFTKHPGKHKLWLDIDEKLGELENIHKEDLSTITVWEPNETLGATSIQIVQVDPSRKNPYAGTKITEKPRGYQKIVDITNELLALGYSASRGEKPFPYDLLVVDSLTRIMAHLEYLVMFQHGTSNMTETLYGVVKRNITEWLFGFLNLPCDRVVIAHDKHVEKRDKDGAIMQSFTRPLITGSMANDIVSYFSEAYYFLGRQGDNKWRIQTMTDRMLPARTSKKLEFEQELDPKVIFGF